MKSTTPPLKWSFLQKAVLLMTFVAAVGIVAFGVWFSNVLDHTQFRVPGRMMITESNELRLPPEQLSKLKKQTYDAPLPTLPVLTHVPPSNVLYDQAQKAFEKDDNPEAYRLLDLLLKTYPTAPESDAAKKSLDVVIKAMLLKASGGLNPGQVNTIWHYQSKDNNLFATIDNTVAPVVQPTPSSSDEEADGNTNTTATSLPQPEEQLPHYKLGVIRAPVDDQNSLYGLAIYGYFDEAKKACGHPTPCQIRITVQGQSMMADVAYQDSSKNGALKLTNPTQVVDILNDLSSSSVLQVDMNGSVASFNVKGLNWRQLKVDRSDIGHLHQDVQALQSESPQPSSSTPDPANNITLMPSPDAGQ